MKITSKGQVTIPAGLRERAGLLPNTEVEFVLSGKKLWLQKTEGKRRRGSRLVDALRGKGTVRMSTDQIMALTRGER